MGRQTPTRSKTNAYGKPCCTSEYHTQTTAKSKTGDHLAVEFLLPGDEAKRQAEVELLPLAEAENIAVISYSPVGGGLLSGKYADGPATADGRLATNKMYTGRYGDEDNFRVAARFSAYAKEHGEHPVSLAVAWVLAHPAVTCPIIGARNLDQLAGSLGAVDVTMSSSRREQISALAPAPALATDREEER